MLLFVYGSLRQDGPNHHVIAEKGRLMYGCASMDCKTNDLFWRCEGVVAQHKKNDESSDAIVEGEIWYVSNLYVRQVLDPFEAGMRFVRLPVRLRSPEYIRQDVFAYVVQD
jgi:gamma-glutamylcyclotransferase (GGCT)/AIG2-like uncharacterized protein YtfP